MANRVCEKCIHYDVCLLHEDNFIEDVAENGFCGKFRDTADVVEVVKCHKCKHFMYSDCYGECNLHFKIVKPIGFCSYGERRE